GLDLVDVEVRPAADVFGLRETHGAVLVDGKVAGAMPGRVKLSWCKPEAVEVHLQHLNEREATARWDDDDAPPIKPPVPTVRNTTGQVIEVPVPRRWLMDSQTITDTKSGMQYARKTQEMQYAQSMCPPQFHLAREVNYPSVPESEWDPLRSLSGAQVRVAMGLEGDGAQLWVSSREWPTTSCQWWASSVMCATVGLTEPTERHRPLCVRNTSAR
ncbi:MAG: hypothetical protein JST92_27600, partial [Deltaproteobacteria bacterium]|nr:hypothetical protein [Deltaproteobacteria bacterium]